MKNPVLLALSLIALLGAHAMEPDNAHETLVPLLKKMVELSSDSADPKGVNANQKLVQAELEKLGFQTKLIPQPQKSAQSGELLIAEFKGPTRIS